MNLLPFQRRFLKAATGPGSRIAALSGPRGLGKTTPVAHLARRSLTPGDPLHHPEGEAHVAERPSGGPFNSS